MIATDLNKLFIGKLNILIPSKFKKSKFKRRIKEKNNDRLHFPSKHNSEHVRRVQIQTRKGRLSVIVRVL